MIHAYLLLRLSCYPDIARHGSAVVDRDGESCFRRPVLGLEDIVAAEARGAWDLALRGYQQLLVDHPEDHRLLANAGQASWYLDCPREAMLCYRQALALQPCDPLPWLGLANALRDLNRFEQADAAYRRSWQLASEPITAWNHSQLLIGLECYPQAYALAEQRLLLPQLEPYRRGVHGGAISASAHERLYVWSEQGFGDGLQYLRWCVPLSEAGPALTLELDTPLVSLVREGLAWLARPPEVVPQTGTPPPLPAAAGHASLLSLPHHCGGAPLSNVFQPAEPPGHWHGYLRSPSWPRRPPGVRPRVGLVWAAGRKLEDPFAAREYRKRTLPPQALRDLILGLRHLEAELVALQIGPDHNIATPWRELLVDELPQNADFALTARWIHQLDLLISVDTAAAHLAGALGHPCWILLPYSADPRWLRARSDSPWYPSLRLFRQPSTGQWQPVIAQVLEAFSPWWRSTSG